MIIMQYNLFLQDEFIVNFVEYNKSNKLPIYEGELPLDLIPDTADYNYKYVDGEIIPLYDIRLFNTRNDKCQYVNTIRQERLEAGFSYGKFKIKADALAQNSVTIYLMSDFTEPIMWRTMKNDYVYLNSLGELKKFASAMSRFIQKVYKDSWLAKDRIKKVATIEEINNAVDKYIAIG